MFHEVGKKLGNKKNLNMRRSSGMIVSVIRKKSNTNTRKIPFIGEGRINLNII
jgi:hypothetical protein